MVDLVKIEFYDGTMESLENIVKNLKLQDKTYHFNVITKEFYIHHLGTIYKPGDCYQYLVNEKLYAI